LIRIQQLLRQQNFVAARSELGQALRADPGNAVLYNFLGVLAAQQGNYSQSEQAFQKASAIAPDMLQAYLNLGRLYRDNMGHDQEAGRKALKAYRCILRLDPSHVEARYELAALLQQQGDYQLSEQQLARLSSVVSLRRF
jgi:cytochrome c-type biogenesis protein CcmH/NrfG